MKKKQLAFVVAMLHYTLLQAQCIIPKIFFSSPSTTNPVTNIWVMDSSGANRKTLFNDAYYRQSLTISNDGTKMAYTKRKKPNTSGGGDSLWICTAKIDGTNEQNVYFLPTFSNTEIRNLDFNNNDTKLLFNKYLDGWPATIRDGDLFLLDLRTLSVSQLTTDVNYAKFNPTFSKNDSVISFCYLSSGWYAFPQPAYTMNLFTGMRKLFDPKGSGTYCSSIWTSGLQYNPRGNKVVFQFSNNVSGPAGLYISDTNGTNLINLNYTAAGLNQALFSPSGNSVGIIDNNNLKYLTLTGTVYKTITPSINTAFGDINWVNTNANTFKAISKIICEGQSYLGYSKTGIYKDTFVNSVGCDSIRTLNLKVRARTYSTISKAICTGQSYLGYTITGIYKDTFVNSVGCDSVRTLILTVNSKTFSTINKSICEGQSFLGYSKTGKYIDTLKNANGCDSIRTLNLRVKLKSYLNINSIICAGKSYIGYSATGIYKDTFVNSVGCDSVRTLSLTVTPRSYSNFNKTICAGQNFLGYSTPGIYKDTFVNSLGCDSVRTINLKVRPRTYSTFTKTICAGQSFLGYTIAGVYYDTFVNRFGCDSIRTINLTITPRAYSTINMSICAGQSFLGYSITGIYSDTLVSSMGCDSVRTLNLTVKPRTYSTINKTIFVGQSFLGYTKTGVYNDTLINSVGCDSIRTLNLTVSPIPTLTFNKTMQQNQGTILDQFRGSNNTSNYIKAVDFLKLLSNSSKSNISIEKSAPTSLQVSIFPNPTGNVFNVTVKAPKQESISMRVLDVNGRTSFMAKGMPGQTFRFGEQLKMGTYLVEVRQGNEVKTMKAVKMR